MCLIKNNFLKIILYVECKSEQYFGTEGVFKIIYKHILVKIHLRHFFLLTSILKILYKY